MADVNVIAGIQMMLFIWDKTADVPAWLPIGCMQSTSFNTDLTVSEVAKIQTSCGIIPAKNSIDALTFQFTGNGFAVDTQSQGSVDANKASHDRLLAAQRAYRTNGGIPDDWKLVSMAEPGIADIFGKGHVTSLSKTGDTEDNSYQNFTYTVTGVPDTLSDTSTVDE